MKKGLFQSVIWLAFILITTQSRAQSVVQPLLHAFEQLDKDTCLKKADISFCLLDINTGKVIVEKNKDKLIALYNDGYNDAKDSYKKIIEFINK